MTTAVIRNERRISPVFLGLVAVMGVSAWAVWRDVPASPGISVFVFVVSGWVVSLCLHEYAHARTALHGGDLSVGSKGYLTLNPLKYAHVALSIVLPVVFVVLGGIGLPGGAVFIERHRIRGRWRHSLISAAGPLTNVLFAAALTAPFWLGTMGGVPEVFRYALAFAAMLQVTAAILNFLPVPGLDGYGVLEPWLSPAVKRQVEPFAPFGLLAVFGILWIPEVNSVFWQAIDGVMRGLGVADGETSLGLDYFRFWQGEPRTAGSLFTP
jgi:Zn-dependent protease